MSCVTYKGIVQAIDYKDLNPNLAREKVAFFSLARNWLWKNLSYWTEA